MATHNAMVAPGEEVDELIQKVSSEYYTPIRNNLPLL